MLRCHRCGGKAQAGLAHLHGDPTYPLCGSCTKFVLAERRAKEARRQLLANIRTVLRHTSVRQAA
jgi:hypothetical protein